MMIFSPPKGWWATHPSVESRIAALEAYAGGKAAAVDNSQQEAAPRLCATRMSARTTTLTDRELRPFGRRVRAS
jgi:hypothetical protein